MINKDNFVVCDKTKIILDDGKTVYPGYIEVKEGREILHSSDDPRNNIPQYLKKGKEIIRNPEHTVGMLLNRKEFERTTVIGTTDNQVLEGKHFMNIPALMAYEQKHTTK
ncbi:MAG: hypothetical protein A2612_01490 [Candidatus Moranbacteria bacterium RIFOXYD1_FULL_44_12]|nr:MAG: hypothetical protein A2612_01490 [Candidatus Moranbacteria bacterium RIFOXYD1_FULL_44_12]OGK67162.1 MAG: hypothetical protein A2377_00810 [Candidatus Roizmanbacteria bacterium RIFOXYB1_FULL_41_27]